MKNALQPVTARVRGGLTVATTFVAAVLSGALTDKVEARFGRTDRGALTLEQAIVTAVLSAAAIALGAVIVAAVMTHQNAIR